MINPNNHAGKDFVENSDPTESMAVAILNDLDLEL